MLLLTVILGPKSWINELKFGIWVALERKKNLLLLLHFWLTSANSLEYWFKALTRMMASCGICSYCVCNWTQQTRKNTNYPMSKKGMRKRMAWKKNWGNYSIKAFMLQIS